MPKPVNDPQSDIDNEIDNPDYNSNQWLFN